MPSDRLAPSSNLLLASLPAHEYRRLLPDLEPVPLPANDVIYNSGQPESHVLFPACGIVSINYRMQDGGALAIALVGSEGMVGLSQFTGGVAPTSNSVVQATGHGFRLAAGVVRREIRSAGQLQALALRYIQALITQMAQTAVCNRHHYLDQQVCRWLLLSLDRLFGNELNMTPELIAHLLGIRHERVSPAMTKLQDAGVLAFRNDRILVIDRAALEARVCECYSVVRNEYDRLLPLPAHRRGHLQVIHGR